MLLKVNFFITKIGYVQNKFLGKMFGLRPIRFLNINVEKWWIYQLTTVITSKRFILHHFYSKVK